MNPFSPNFKYRLPCIITLVALVFFVLGYFSFKAIHSSSITPPQAKLDLLWQVWETMEKKYPFAEPSDQEKIYGAISGIVDTYGDDHSAFLTPIHSEFFNQTISGAFGGAGMEISVRNGYLTVVAPLKDSPAEKSGIKPGDIITHVDGIDISNDSLDEAIGRIRGEVGTSVIITIVRYGEEQPLEISLVRDDVEIPILETESIDETFVIHLYNFNESSERSFEKALQEFKTSGHHQLALDLRNNPGGYLVSAIDIASYFLPQGTIILRETRSEDGTEEEIVYRSRGYDLLSAYDFDMVVLINEGSASASEILAGALGEHGIAIVAGETSYGKGSVQELIQLPQGTSLKVTIAKWLTPEHHQISDTGIIPDVEILFDEEALEDTQLLQALKLL